jgi:UPF0755 protein
MSTRWRRLYFCSMHWRSRTSPLAALAATLAVAACTPSGAPVRVVIPAGATFRAAADSLASAHVIRSARLFRWYAALTHHDRAIKPGTYLLRPGTGWSNTLDALVEGAGLVHSLTIPEGWDITSITPALAQTLNIPAESIAAAVRDSALLDSVGAPPDAGTLEGYLFPDTYTFPDGTTARLAVAEMVREFQRAWRPEWNARADSLGLTRHQILTLASIVEKEVRVGDERPVIAAVYENRLRLHMPLQADPTVQYALGHHVDRVYYKDLDVESPYNTYRHPGLPPGPIASPGAASIAAVLAPADVPYLYFVARPDGHHEFRSTFAEHTAARAEVRQKTHKAR